MNLSKNIKYSFYQCLIKIEDKIFTYNIDFYNDKKKELSFIILKNLEKEFYLYDIELSSNNIVSAKESFKEIGKLSKVLYLKIINKYYDSNLTITPEEIKKYNIKFVNDKEENNVTKRNSYYKITFEELDLLSQNIYPIYFTLNKHIIYLNGLLNKMFINTISKECIKINNIKDILNIKVNCHLNNFVFYFDEVIGKRNNEFNIKMRELSIKNIILKVNKEYMNENLLFNNNLSKTPEESKFILIYDLKINDSNIEFIKINNLYGIYEVIKKGRNFYIINNKEKILINKEFIDNEFITFHSSLEDAKNLYNIKKTNLNKILNNLKGE